MRGWDVTVGREPLILSFPCPRANNRKAKARRVQEKKRKKKKGGKVHCSRGRDLRVQGSLVNRSTTDTAPSVSLQHVALGKGEKGRRGRERVWGGNPLPTPGNEPMMQAAGKVWGRV